MKTSKTSPRKPAPLPAPRPMADDEPMRVSVGYSSIERVPDASYRVTLRGDAGEIAAISAHLSDTACYVSPEDIERTYPDLLGQIEQHPLEPALALLAERRRMSGYAEFAELAAACGISEELSERMAFSVRLAARGDVAVEPPIGIDEPAKYRLLA